MLAELNKPILFLIESTYFLYTESFPFFFRCEAAAVAQLMRIHTKATWKRDQGIIPSALHIKAT